MPVSNPIIAVYQISWDLPEPTRIGRQAMAEIFPKLGSGQYVLFNLKYTCSSPSPIPLNFFT